MRICLAKRVLLLISLFALFVAPALGATPIVVDGDSLKLNGISYRLWGN
jgi:hypothetical protein